MNKALGELEELTLEATIDATQDRCTAYCRASRAADAPSCESDCLSGNRKILAKKDFSHEELVALDQSSRAGIVETAVPLIFKSLGPALSSLHGPDLTVDATAASESAHVSTENFSATDCAVIEGCIGAPGTRRLLRFDGTIRNLGDTDFVLGAPEGNPLFSYSACHDHYHLQDIMLYELLTADTRQPVAVGGAHAVGRKQGFCMEDINQIAGSSEQKYSCDYQGISAGWADIYDSSLDCQWIDVTGVAPGSYILRITVNPSGLYFESDRSNNSVDAPVTITP